MNNIVLELKETLNLMSITGIKSIYEDFRLNKLYSKIKLLAEKSTVFNEMSKFIENLSKESNVFAFLELINLVNSILYVQNGISIDLKKSDIDIFKHTTSLNCIKYSTVVKVKAALRNKSNSKWSDLETSYKKNGLADYRLLNDFLDELNNTYVYGINFSIVTILSSYGQDIAPILLKTFDNTETANSAKINIIKILSNIDNEIYNEYFKTWVETENTYIAEEALRTLANNIANEEFILNYNSKKKKLRQAKFYCLSHMNSSKAKEAIKEIYRNDIEIFKNEFDNVYHLVEDVVIDLLTYSFEQLKLFNFDEENQTQLSKDIINNFYYILNCSSNYQNKIITDILIEMLKTETKLNYNKKMIALNLFNRADKTALKYLTTLKDKDKGYYIEISFVSALKILEKEKLFEEFSTLVLKKFNSKTSPLMDIIENIFNKVVKINPECVNCPSYNTCNSVSRPIDRNNKKFEVAENLYMSQKERNEIEWDKRWFKYMLENNEDSFACYFIPKNIANESKDKLKQYYIKSLNELKESVPNKYYPATTHETQKVTEANIRKVMLGLLSTGAKDEAINSLVYFCYHLSILYNVFYENLEPNDLPKLKQLEKDVDYLPKHIKLSIREFIAQNRINIAQKYNIKN